MQKLMEDKKGYKKFLIKEKIEKLNNQLHMANKDVKRLAADLKKIPPCVSVRKTKGSKSRIERYTVKSIAGRWHYFVIMKKPEILRARLYKLNQKLLK